MPASHNPTWPKKLLDFTKPIYESGKFSMSQIAAEVREESIRLTGHAKTRNAIIGKAKREGWINPNPQRGGTKPGEKRPRQSKLWRGYVTAPILEQPKEPPQPENFLGLTIQAIKSSECRYPDGIETPYNFCGNPTQDGSSYCKFHHALCWQRPTHIGRQFVSRQKF